jgi:hypothetical protein
MPGACDSSGLVKRIALPIARLEPATPAPTGDTVTLWMTNPSALLVASIAIVPDRAPGGAVMAFSGAATWQVFPAVPASGGSDLSEPVPLAAVFPAARALPDAFVIDDPIKLIKIMADIYSNTAGAGMVWAIATWEPKDACLRTELRDDLFSQCQLTIDGGDAAGRVFKAGPGV